MQIRLPLAGMLLDQPQVGCFRLALQPLSPRATTSTVNPHTHGRYRCETLTIHCGQNSFPRKPVTEVTENALNLVLWQSELAAEKRCKKDGKCAPTVGANRR